MMGDHSNEETEYPTNSTSAVDGRDDTPVPSTLPPSSTEEEDLWQGYLMILIFLIFLGGAYFAILSYERRWLFECTWYGFTCVFFSGTSSHTVPGRTTVFSCKTSNMFLIIPFRTLSSDENSRHIFGKREKARRKEQLEKELKVKVRATLLLGAGCLLPLVSDFQLTIFSSHGRDGARAILKKVKWHIMLQSNLTTTSPPPRPSA
jgi:hypothetical protein